MSIWNELYMIIQFDPSLVLGGLAPKRPSNACMSAAIFQHPSNIFVQRSVDYNGHSTGEAVFEGHRSSA